MNATRNLIIVDDARSALATLPDASIDTVITSPPYFGLRDYGDRRQIGLEEAVGGWVNELRDMLRELARVLKPSGSLWLNLGDSFSHHQRTGAPPKSLLLGPERLALAMIEDGWIVRNKVVWAKTNAMPISVADRLACKYEVLYFATRSPRYFFDLDAIRLPHRSSLKGPSAAAARRAATATRPTWAGPLAGDNRGLDGLKARGLSGHPLGKNPGDVWSFATSSFRGAHHATFPIDLITRPLLATCPERVCSSCGLPWLRHHARRHGALAVIGAAARRCSCKAGTLPGVVLDPFIGAGTVALAAEAHGRDWLGIELNPEFAALAEERIAVERAKRRVREEDAMAA
ncbi:MAG TPA: site-specific DNA-methyltransferase [Polyangiaceae bacterium]|jgi:DNA modification methylase|nr:site-specific DNA-methyltransferase [Polyangiaceae bacterium]